MLLIACCWLIAYAAHYIKTPSGRLLGNLDGLVQALQATAAIMVALVTAAVMGALVTALDMAAMAMAAAAMAVLVMGQVLMAAVTAVGMVVAACMEGQPMADP